MTLKKKIEYPSNSAQDLFLEKYMGKTTETTTTTPEFELVSVEIQKLKAGEELVGVLNKITDRPWMDRTSGEMKTIKQFHITRLDGQSIIYFGDAGFQNSMLMSDIQVGDMFKAVKKPKTELKGGRTVNQYDIYKAKNKTAH